MDVAAPVARGVKAPEEPTPEQRERHNLTHIPFEPWCDDCVRGRSPDDPHPSKSEKSPLPVIQIDYFFVRTDQDMILAKGLSAVDSVYGRTLAVDCQQKGAGDKGAVKQLVNYIRSLGFERAHLQHDKENSISEVANAVAGKIPGLMPRETPKASKQFLGGAERFHRTVEGLMRTLRLSIIRTYGVSVHATHTLTAWMMRHAAWLHDHYQVQRVDGSTPYKRHQLRDYNSAVAPFAETVAWREPGPHVTKLKEKWGHGIWVGRENASNSHLVLTRVGAIPCRAIRRLPPSERYDKQLLLTITGHPCHFEAVPPAPPSQNPAQDATNTNKSSPSDATAAAAPSAPAQAGLSEKSEQMDIDNPERMDTDLTVEDLAVNEPLRRGRGRPATRGTPDPFSANYTPGCGGCEGRSWYHVKSCPQHVPKEERENRSIARVIERDAAIRDATSDMDVSGAACVEVVYTLAGKEYPCPEEEVPKVYYEEDDGSILPSDQVHAGINRELDRMARLNVSSRVLRSDVPKGSKVWSARWCHRRKGDGVRSRYVVRQFRDSDWETAFSGVPGLTVVRVLLAVCVIEDLEAVPGDFETAFMNTPLDEEVFIEPPPVAETDRRYVWLLGKALNGLKKASLLFQRFLTSILVDHLDFEKCPLVPTLFRHEKAGLKVCIHVDDPLAVAKTGVSEAFYAKLGEWLTVRKTMPIQALNSSIYLGARYWRIANGFVEAPMENYLEDTSVLLGVGTATSVATPGVPRKLHELDMTPLDSQEHSVYRGGVGKYQYILPRRPDLLFASKECGRRLHAPRQCDLSALKRTARYVNGTLDHKLFLVMDHRTVKAARAGQVTLLKGKTDADWAGDVEERKSTNCTFCVWGGFLLSSFARTQSLRALSSPESEYFGICAAGAELINVAGLIDFCGYKVQKQIESDASGAIAIASRQGCGGVRHLEARYLWIQDHVQSGNIVIDKVPGDSNLPDIGTKHVKREMLEWCCREIGLRPWRAPDERPPEERPHSAANICAAVAAAGGGREGLARALANLTLPVPRPLPDDNRWKWTTGKYDPVTRDRNNPFAHPEAGAAVWRTILWCLYNEYARDQLPRFETIYEKHKGKEYAACVGMIFKYVPYADCAQAIVSLDEYITLEENHVAVKEELADIEPQERRAPKRQKRAAQPAKSACSNTELPKYVCRVYGKHGHWGNECPTLPQNAPWRKKSRKQ